MYYLKYPLWGNNSRKDENYRIHNLFYDKIEDDQAEFLTKNHR